MLIADAPDGAFSAILLIEEKPAETAREERLDDRLHDNIRQGGGA